MNSIKANGLSIESSHQVDLNQKVDIYEKSYGQKVLTNLKILFEIFLLICVTTFYVFVWFFGLFIWTKKKNVKGQLVLVTGGSRGFGREISIQFASLGCDVVFASIDENLGPITEEEIRKAYPDVKIKFYKIDVSKPEEIDTLKANIQRDFGRNLDILINNAGVMDMVNIIEDDASVFRRTIEVNFLAHVWTIKAFLPQMIQTGRGLIVAVISEAYFSGARYGAAYCSSKTAIKTLMESVKDDLKMRNIQGIDVCCALPYFMKTDYEMLERFNFLIPPISPKYAAKVLVDNALRNVSCFTIPTQHFYLMNTFKFLPDNVRFKVLNYMLPRFLGITVKPEEILKKQKLNKVKQGNGVVNMKQIVN